MNQRRLIATGSALLASAILAACGSMGGKPSTAVELVPTAAITPNPTRGKDRSSACPYGYPPLPWTRPTAHSSRDFNTAHSNSAPLLVRIRMTSVRGLTDHAALPLGRHAADRSTTVSTAAEI